MQHPPARVAEQRDQCRSSSILPTMASSSTPTPKPAAICRAVGSFAKDNEARAKNKVSAVLVTSRPVRETLDDAVVSGSGPVKRPTQ
jgi:hypothetical protein